jgi:uroporphyrinogen-III synthase
VHILLTRPLPESEATARKLQDMGHTSAIEPLLELQMLDHALPDAGDIQAILLTSSNGARALARQSIGRDLPVYTVGSATAAGAGDAGFTDVKSADGDVFALTRLVTQNCRPEAGVLVHLSGEDSAGDLAGALQQAGYKIHRVVVYRAVARAALSEAVTAAMRANAFDGVLLFSPRTAAIFEDLVLRDGLGEACGELDLYAMSQAVSHATGRLSYRHRHIAKYPSQADLLELLASSAI